MCSVDESSRWLGLWYIRHVQESPFGTVFMVFGTIKSMLCLFVGLYGVLYMYMIVVDVGVCGWDDVLMMGTLFWYIYIYILG